LPWHFLFLIKRNLSMKTIFIMLSVFLSSAYHVSGQWRIEIESGSVFQGYNNVRIPNEMGTTFSFLDDFELQGLVIPFRIRTAVTFGGGRNHISALYAPLSLDYQGEAPFDIRFQQTNFSQGDFIDGFYKFNSYRLTYRRNFIHQNRWLAGVGFTAKIRDASVQLSTGGMSDRKDDIGFVPLLNIYGAWRGDNARLWIEGDGLAGGPGRAFDFFAGGEVLLLHDYMWLKGGYRILEGGANVDDVYNFTLIHFAVIGLSFEF
jgi:hypothetical protein